MLDIVLKNLVEFDFYIIVIILFLSILHNHLCQIHKSRLTENRSGGSCTGRICFLSLTQCTGNATPALHCIPKAGRAGSAWPAFENMINYAASKVTLFAQLTK